MLVTALKDILITLYENAFGALIYAVMAMIVIRCAREKGARNLVREWIDSFLHDRQFRWQFLLVMYTFIIIGKTIIGRSIWCNPVENIMGKWRFILSDGSVNTDLFENLFMLTPYIFLLYEAVPGILEKRQVCGGGILDIFVKSVIISFGTSLTIEFCQLFFKFGTFQLSDITFNTIGGLAGGLIYWIVTKIKRR